MIEILLDRTKTLGHQGIAFKGHGDDNEGIFYQIVMLTAKYSPKLKYWFNTTRMRPYHVTYLSAQSQNEFIELIGRQVQKRVTEEIKEAGMYSVMADTTPDVSHKYRLAITCRYVDANGEPRERLISLTETKDKTGDRGAINLLLIELLEQEIVETLTYAVMANGPTPNSSVLIEDYFSSCQNLYQQNTIITSTLFKEANLTCQGKGFV